MDDLEGYVNSYHEHSNKIVKAMGDPSQVYNIRGWLGDCRHFAEKANNAAISILNSGGKVINKKDGREWDRSDVETAFGNRMEWILRAERQNEEIARKHGY